MSERSHHIQTFRKGRAPLPAVRPTLDRSSSPSVVCGRMSPKLLGASTDGPLTARVLGLVDAMWRPAAQLTGVASAGGVCVATGYSPTPVGSGGFLRRGDASEQSSSSGTYGVVVGVIVVVYLCPQLREGA